MSVMVLTWSKIQWTQYGELALRFLAVTAGVLGREIFEEMIRGAGYRLIGIRLALALMGALVTFPALQQALERRKPTSRWLQLLMAFQYGFCWRALAGLEG